MQVRRWLPTALTQTAQRAIHARLLGPALSGGTDMIGAETGTLPVPIRLLQRFPVLQAVPATAVGIGLLPEHAPAFARRGGSSRGSTGSRPGW